MAGTPATTPKTADGLRRAFLDFFVARGHTAVPSASLIPHDPTVMFTVAGMVPFKSYFVGDEVAPYPRAVSVQKCARAGGKHNDLDEVGRTTRHLVFFEMLGNFSFGDYFKEDAIPWSWELVTEVFGLDGDRLWITVHQSDDEAEQIWHDVVGVPMSRIQRLGDEDNFWQMGETGPCGPCSEIHIDRGPTFGPEGGPLNDPGGDRFLEFWNLVFMQYNQAPDGTRTPLPRPSIDTGAGMERILSLMQGVDSVWETDVLSPLIEEGRSICDTPYLAGDYEDRNSFSLRVLAEHARSATMLVVDGVFPSNEGRGYVLRRIIRRAVRHAFLLGAEDLVLPRLVRVASQTMGAAYPEIPSSVDFIVDVVGREEERFRRTLKSGLAILEEDLRKSTTIGGSAAFLLHDTYGFPLELTQEIAVERGLEVDIVGFEREMDDQRSRARAASKMSVADETSMDLYRTILERHGTTNFVGYHRDSVEATVLEVLERGDGLVEVFLDVTPFYAESGGQVGDQGTISGSGVEIEVLDTVFALPELRRHLGRVISGDLQPGRVVTATIDGDKRRSTRRNHTATHLLHWALRHVLGEHVKQAGSLVGPDRLRFDFSHYAPVTDDEIARIEQLVNLAVLGNSSVDTIETTKSEAIDLGAIAFFGDKYGEKVRVLRAGPSLEFCGGTHVRLTGDIGLVKVVSEGSIGSNLRRIEATTGVKSVEAAQSAFAALHEASETLGVGHDDLVEGARRKVDEIRRLQDENRNLRARLARSAAEELSAASVDGVVVARVDGVQPSEMRDLAIAIRQRPGVRVVVLGGVAETGGVALVGALGSGVQGSAADLLRDAAAAVGGGGGGKGDVATAGGKNASALDAALELARQQAREFVR